MKPCGVENDRKTLSRGFLSPVSMGLILVFTQLFYSKLLARSLKLGYTTLLSIIMTLQLCRTATKSLDWAKITFYAILVSLLTENGIFHCFSRVNKHFWPPNRSFQLEQGFLKISSQPRIAKFGKWINNFYW